jgi:hypothetical protein
MYNYFLCDFIKSKNEKNLKLVVLFIWVVLLECFNETIYLIDWAFYFIILFKFFFFGSFSISLPLESFSEKKWKNKNVIGQQNKHSAKFSAGFKTQSSTNFELFSIEFTLVSKYWHH